MEGEMQNFVPRSMRLSAKEAVLRGVNYRTQKRVVPAGGKGVQYGSGYNPENNQIEFMFTDAEGISLVDTAVRFRADFYLDNSSYGSGNADVNGSFTSAGDVVERVEMYVGQTSVLSTTVSRVRNLVNAMIKNELSEDWFKYAGKNLLGWNSHGLNGAASDAVASHATDGVSGRDFIVPLWVLHPAFLSEHLPVLGEQIRIVLTLAHPSACLATRTTDDPQSATYQLSDVELAVEHIQYESDYKRALMAQIAGGEGFSIPMIDFDIQRQNYTGTDIAFTQRNQRSNCLSMVLFNAKTEAGRLDHSTTDGSVVHSDPTLHSELGRLASSLKIFSGDRHFTPLNGVETRPEYLANLERCAGGFGKQDNGTISWDEYTSTSNAIVNHAPIMVSLERTQLDDTDYQVTNRGLSAYDSMVDADIQVQLTLSSGLDTTKDELYSALVYEKTLVMGNGAISVDA